MSPEWSAGGVVIRENMGKRELAVIQPRGKTILCLPKGHVDPGETPEAAAIREVHEETGLTATVEADLGEIRYAYQFRGRTIHKRVTFFLLRYVQGEIDQLDPRMRKEVDHAQWIRLDEATQRLAYSGEREVIARAHALLEAPEQTA